MTYPCPKCAAAVAVAITPTWETAAKCSGCGTQFIVRAFPALVEPAQPIRAMPVLSGNESSCFYHPDKLAVHMCTHCGRFLCSLCDVELRGVHLCPSCVSNGKGETGGLETTSEVLYDSLCLATAVLPVIAMPFTLFSAPAVMYLIFRYYRQPLGVLPRRRWRYWLAGFIALLQMGGWTAVFVGLAKKYL